MSEPIKQNPAPPKRSKRKPAMEPLGWDEIVSQPGMGGYLSFLNGPVPLPHLQNPGAGPVLDPGVDSTTRTDPIGAAEPTTLPIKTPANSPAPGVVSALPDGPVPVVESTPPIASASGLATARASAVMTPEVFSIPVAQIGPRLRIRKCAATHDGHSLGEEVLYQALWKAARPESAEARSIVIGWRGMSQLCRMTPKNCKINTQRLIRKLALEVLSPYNTPESIGTTYRVYSDEATLRRRSDAGLQWVIRSRGVEFVDPRTGSAILPNCAVTC